jgi:diguanylate cyclase (GGDEF)-like protein
MTMAYFANILFRRFTILFAGMLAILAAGTWLTVKIATDSLVDKYVTVTATDWSRFLAENVTDLREIAAGEQPSVASMAFFASTQKSGKVFRYIIFDRQGYSQLIADPDKIAPVDLSEYSPEAKRAVSQGLPVVDIKRGKSPNFPTIFAEAYVPAFVGDKTVAVVAAYVDYAKVSAAISSTFWQAAVSLCLLTVLAFTIPAVAWYRRTREKQLADRRIRFLAHHDSLTSLINRARLIERLDAMLAALPSTGGQIALHFIDLDRFKEVNDSLGHDGGDFLLKTIAQRLSALTRREEIVARLGGDEFVAVQTAIGDKSEVEEFAKRIARLLSEPMMFKDQEIKASVTIGVALAPTDGMTSERLLKSADLALYSGKEAGRDCIRFFAPEMDEALEAHLTLEKAIRDAIASDGFVLHYQPVFEISHNRLIGYEALVRLPAKDGTLIPPDKFIPVAEEAHLIDALGALVLRNACVTAAAWPQELTVAVNLSPTQFESGTIVEVVAAALEESGLDPHRLELEIIETLLLGTNERTMQQLVALKALGVSIVMDDFGTGYSSLSYLWKFPFDKIKIDRSFMQNFEKSGRDVETVIKSIIALGRELRMRVTVEGVETLNQANFLDQANADQVQGFYFGRPMPASEIGANILAEFRKRSPVSVSPDGAKFKLVK